MNNNFFGFDIGAIADELYDKSKLGGIVVPDFLSTGLRECLLAEVTKLSYKEAPKRYGRAYQELSCSELEAGAIHDFPAICLLRETVLPSYEQIALRAHFENRLMLNSVVVNRFERGSTGITPHRDENKYINVIYIFVISGEAAFYVCTDRKKSCVEELPAMPGSLILLRAQRNANEKGRPMHAVGPVTKERHTISFRDYAK